MAGRLLGIWDLEALLECALTELAAAGLPTPALVAAVAGNTPAVDECCEGFLYARVIQQHVAAQNPPLYTGVDPRNCGGGFGAQIGLGLWRCQTGLWRLDQANAPTGAEQTSDMELVLEDAKALFAAICCAEALADTWTPLGADGGCVGGEWILHMSGTPEPEDSE